MLSVATTSATGGAQSTLALTCAIMHGNGDLTNLPPSSEFVCVTSVIPWRSLRNEVPLRNNHPSYRRAQPVLYEVIMIKLVELKFPKPLIFTYRNHEDKIVQRHVYQPQMLYGKFPPWYPEEGWFIKGFDNSRAAMRTFSVERIISFDKQED